MARLPPGPRLSYILGDIRDQSRLDIAAHGVTAIVHAAALKIVGQGERHAAEFVGVNITGTMNVIRAALSNGVSRALFISSDKAVEPINHYGKSKAAAEGMFIEANSLGVSRGCRFAIVRGGNVWASRGSVIEKWNEQWREHRPIVVHNEDTTRFHMPMDYWLDFCIRALDEMHGGETYVPKVGAWRLGDLAVAYQHNHGCEIEYANARDGDKEHECLIAPAEILRTVDVGWAYIVEPSNDIRQVWDYASHPGLAITGAVTSNKVERMSAEELRRIV